MGFARSASEPRTMRRATTLRIAVLLVACDPTAAMQLARRSVLDTTLTTLPSLTLACSEDDCIFERRRKFERLGRTLTVDQDFAGSRSRSTGAGVWECSEVLSAYLAARPELCRGRRVLELGAGCGLCSMVASLGGAARVVATDGDGRCRGS